MESDSAMDSDSDAEAPERRRMSYMYFFEAKINYNHRDWDAMTYMRRYLDLRRYKLKQPELIAFAAIDQEPPDDDTSCTSNQSLSVTGIICGYGIRYAAVQKYLDDDFEVFPIPSGTERTNQRVRDFLSQSERVPSGRRGLTLRVDYIGNSSTLDDDFHRESPNDGNSRLLEDDDESDDDESDGDIESEKNLRVDFDDANFKSCAWKFSGDWQFLDDIKTDFQEIYLSQIPVKVEYMVIYSNVNVREAPRQHIAGCTRCTAIRGYIEGKGVPLAVWSTWLNQGMSWAPVTEIAFDAEYLADVARAKDATSTWRVLVTHGNRPQFRARGQSFRFELRVEIIAACGTDDDADDAPDLLDIVKHKFCSMAGFPEDDDNGGNIRCKGITYMEVMCDVRPLAAAHAVGQTLNVDVKGYIQCKQSDLRKWQEWIIHARWTLLRGGLRRDPDYAQSHSPWSEWQSIYTFGNAGRITAGISAKMKASITPSLPRSPSLSPTASAPARA